VALAGEEEWELVALELDVRRGDAVTTLVVDQPDDDDVERALDCLDELHHTELTIVGDDGQYLVVRGGNGRYHVSISSDEHDDTIVLQAVATEPSGEAMTTVGGLSVRVPARSVVGRVEAARAAQWFLASGRPDPGQAWR
jgi:hypothetical protein